MKNPAPYLRKAIYTLLNGNVSYNGVQVPIYENPENNIPYQVNIGSYSDADSSNKRNFASTATQIIEVVALQDSEVKKHVDAIGNIVGNLIKPTPGTTGIASDNEWQVFVERPSLDHLVENAGDGRYYVRLIMRFSLFINEK